MSVGAPADPVRYDFTGSSLAPLQGTPPSGLALSGFIVLDSSDIDSTQKEYVPLSASFTDGVSTRNTRNSVITNLLLQIIDNQIVNWLGELQNADGRQGGEHWRIQFASSALDVSAYCEDGFCQGASASVAATSVDGVWSAPTVVPIPATLPLLVAASLLLVTMRKIRRSR